MKIKSILLVLITIFSMVVFASLELSASTTSVLVPKLISDHQVTSAYGSIYFLDAKPTQNAFEQPSPSDARGRGHRRLPRKKDRRVDSPGLKTRRSGINYSSVITTPNFRVF